jgi:hypothetical protein
MSHQQSACHPLFETVVAVARGGLRGKAKRTAGDAAAPRVLLQNVAKCFCRYTKHYARRLYHDVLVADVVTKMNRQALAASQSLLKTLSTR